MPPQAGGNTADQKDQAQRNDDDEDFEIQLEDRAPYEIGMDTGASGPMAGAGDEVGPYLVPTLG